MGNVNYELHGSIESVRFDNTGKVYFNPDLDLSDFRYAGLLPPEYGDPMLDYTVTNYNLVYSLLQKSGVNVFEKYGIYLWDNIHFTEASPYEHITGYNKKPDSYGGIIYFTDEDSRDYLAVGVEIFGKAFALANGILFTSQIKSFTRTE